MLLGQRPAALTTTDAVPPPGGFFISEVKNEEGRDVTYFAMGLTALGLILVGLSLYSELRFVPREDKAEVAGNFRIFGATMIGVALVMFIFG